MICFFFFFFDFMKKLDFDILGKFLERNGVGMV
jgi:hypothetical protein